jgi:uncharacterized membrane protein YphA (DoxX/SURF4 family)
LAAVFFWFGALKLAGVSPVVEMLRGSFPLLADAPFLQLLGVAEVLIAAGLILNRLSRQTAFLMVLHLTATLGVAVLSPRTVFAPAFPVLTMAGEFLAKNLVLLAAGVTILVSGGRGRVGADSGAPETHP